MEEKQPFRLNTDDIPSSGLRSFLNPKYCFGQGNFKKTEDDRIVLDGRCRIVQFGHPPGKHCVFVLDGNVSPSSSENPQMTAMALMFDDMGRVEDAKFGNGTMKKVDDPEDVRSGRWIMNIPNGTHASFGHLPTKQSWTCTRVLKGSFDFVGCERTSTEIRMMTMSDRSLIEIVQGTYRYSCVLASRTLDERLEMSPENASKIQPFFETIFGKVARYGTHSNQYNHGMVRDYLSLSNTGHESFVYLTPDGTMKELETRNGDPVNPLLPRLSAKITDNGFKTKLQECVASLEVDMPALRWLASHPLEFSGTNTVFVNRAFGWVQDLHSKFLNLAPGLSHDLFKKLATTPLLPNSAAPKTLMQCACTPSKRDPLCRNKICTRMTRMSKFFVWPSFKFVPNADQAGLRDDKQKQKQQKREAVAAAKKSEEEAMQRKEEEARQRKEEEARQIKEAQARNRQEAKAAAAAAAAAERAQSEAPTRSSRRSASSAPGTSEAPPSNKRASSAAPAPAPASKRASSSSTASAAKRSKQGGTRRRRRRHHRRSIRR
jgi:hypothetical protein